MLIQIASNHIWDNENPTFFCFNLIEIKGGLLTVHRWWWPSFRPFIREIICKQLKDPLFNHRLFSQVISNGSHQRLMISWWNLLSYKEGLSLSWDVETLGRRDIETLSNLFLSWDRVFYWLTQLMTQCWCTLTKALTEHFIQGNVPLKHLLNEETLFTMSWQRSAI